MADPDARSSTIAGSPTAWTGRVAECADLLVSLTPRLQLRDAQALAQTCRACRAAVARASAELRGLALVRSWLLASCPHAGPQASGCCAGVHAG